MSHPRDTEAGEYVLGTLPPDERAAFERDLAGDADLRAAVHGWQESLGALGHEIAPVAAPPAVWDSIARRMEPAPADSLADNVVPLDALRRSRSRWRMAAAGLSAIAAALLVFIFVDRTPPAGGADRFIAVVNRGGDLPALIVRVDTKAGLVLVRPVSIDKPADRSLELWYVGPGETPKSLGLVDDPVKAVSIDYRQAVKPGAVFAVTVEPPGGSPNKVATGPIVYSGSLLREER